MSQDNLDYKNLFNHKKVNLMKKFIQHGNVNTYKHALNVVKMGIRINNFFHLESDRKELIFGAMLHDFYLYDWHKKSIKKLHGFFHSRIAVKNAIEEFNINKNIQNIILCHMWPLNITKVPKNKEGWIVCLSDKICTVKEFFSL